MGLGGGGGGSRIPRRGLTSHKRAGNGGCWGQSVGRRRTAILTDRKTDRGGERHRDIERETALRDEQDSQSSIVGPTASQNHQADSGQDPGVSLVLCRPPPPLGRTSGWEEEEEEGWWAGG